MILSDALILLYPYRSFKHSKWYDVTN